jgi:hypothetical protein
MFGRDIERFEEEGLMAVTSRDLHRQPVQKVTTVPAFRTKLVAQQQQLHLVGLILLGAVLLHMVIARGQVWLDDFRYGRPRTTQLSAYVGHNEQPGQPTHFIALNLNRRVVVITLPGGDSTKAQTLQGPYLFGANEDLTPVHLRIQDINQDAKDDLVIAVKNEEILYINTGDSFRLITGEERTQLLEGQQ